MEDEALLKRAEEVLSEIDRSQGLADEHAEVLAALRLRLYGAPKQTLDDVLKAAGELKGRRRLESPPPPRTKASLEDVLGKGGKKLDWPGS
ncbi:MAG: hypothetical protein ACREJP_00625 [Candidatus Methylomirabilales bacterium]